MDHSNTWDSKFFRNVHFWPKLQHTKQSMFLPRTVFAKFVRVLQLCCAEPSPGTQNGDVPLVGCYTLCVATENCGVLCSGSRDLGVAHTESSLPPKVSLSSLMRQKTLRAKHSEYITLDWYFAGQYSAIATRTMAALVMKLRSVIYHCLRL